MPNEPQPLSIPQAIKLALEQHRAGRLEEAEALCWRVLQAQPDNADVLLLLGTIALELKKQATAIELLERALSFRPDSAEAHNNLGNALRDVGKVEAAMASYRIAISFKPDFPEAHNNLGNALKDQGKLEEAAASYRQALALAPNVAEIHSNLGNALREQGKFDEAVASCRKAVALKPHLAEAHNNLGSALSDRGKLDDAAAAYREAIALKPNYPQAHNNLGIALRSLGEFDEALASHHKALSLAPELVEARWAIAMSQLRPVHATQDDARSDRASLEHAIAQLDEWFSGDRIASGSKAVGFLQPFYVAYQEENNKDLLSRYGALCFRLMEDWRVRQGLVYTRAMPQRRVKIGIASAHVFNHPVWQSHLKGWVRHLDRTRFELHLNYLGTVEDEATAFAVRNATTFSQGKGALRPWTETILGQRLDILIYPEVGMDPMTMKLASMRLAPVQMASWGHPETTGLPSIDYYLSAEDFEPPTARENYTERLIALPNTGSCYERASISPAQLDLAALSIDPTRPILLCPGSPFKYAPEHDSLLVEIARQLGKCQFVFFLPRQYESWSKLLHARLSSGFAAAGLAYGDYVVRIPWQNRPGFYGLLQRADVYLDTVGFSGFNTAMQAVECGLPIVTREGTFMRGRLACGILRRIGLAQLVASRDEDYVALVVRLARDKDYRLRIRNRMMESRNVLFDDLATIRALEGFLITSLDDGYTDGVTRG